MNIITITLNPAFDLHYTLPRLDLGKENYVQSCSVSAGGKSVNISRALKANGVDSLACVVMGSDNADAFQAKLREEGLDVLPFLTQGAIRENITVHEADGRETRISLDNFSLSPKMLDRLYMELRDKIRPDTVLTLSGRLPRGIGTEEAKRFCLRLKELTPYLIVDSNSFTTEDLIAISPFLIKPNEHELAAMTGKELNGTEEITAAATELVHAGIAQVLVTLGGKGAVYVGKRLDSGYGVKASVSTAPITPVSTVGAGDSTIAGFIASLVKGDPIEHCLKTAMAFGSGACLREGTAPPLPADVARLRSGVQVTVTV